MYLTGAEISRAHRWSAVGQAIVEHPRYGSITVPCASPLSAVICAAELWRCDWASILDAQVKRIEKEVRDVPG